MAPRLNVNEAERPVDVGKVVIDLPRRFGELERTAQGVRRPGGDLVAVLHRVSHREARVGAREFRIELDRPRIKGARLAVLFAAPNQKKGLRAQEAVVGLETGGVALREPRTLGVADPAGQLLGQAAADLALDGEQVAERPVVALRPELRAGTRVDQPDIDAQAAGLALHAAGDEIARALGRITRRADQAHAREARQVGHQVGADAAGEVALLGAGADASRTAQPSR